MPHNLVSIWEYKPVRCMHGGMEKHNQKAGHANCHRHEIWDTGKNKDKHVWGRQKAAVGQTCRKTGS